MINTSGPNIEVFNQNLNPLPFSTAVGPGDGSDLKMQVIVAGKVVFQLVFNAPMEAQVFEHGFTIVCVLINTYSMKQPDLYYFETMQMTSQAWSNFVWRIRATGEYSL